MKILRMASMLCSSTGTMHRVERGQHPGELVAQHDLVRVEHHTCPDQGDACAHGLGQRLQEWSSGAGSGVLA